MSEYKGIRGWKVQTVSTDPAASILATGAWASGGSLNTASERVGGVGTQTAALSIAAVIVPNTVSGKTESYNGSAWTEVNDLNTTRYMGNFAFGTQTDAIAAGGASTGPGEPTLANVEQWNGTSWTEVGDLNKAKTQGGGSGTTSGGLIFGGFYMPASPLYTILAETESWNGTSWTEVNDLNSSRYTNTSSKDNSQTAIITFGRANQSPISIVESWDGTNWTEVSDLNTGRESPGGAGSLTSAIAFGGTPPITGATEFWNGSSWTEVNDLSTARAGIGGTGSSSAALAFGGYTPTVTTATEEWNTAPAPSFQKENLGQVYYNSTSNAFKVTKTVYGTGAWASGGNLNQARYASSTTGQTQDLALQLGGYNNNTSTNYALTEEYNGTSWTEVNDMNTARRYVGASGSQTSALTYGGNTTAQVANVESWNGTSWTETTDKNTSNSAAGAAGISSTSALSYTGAVPGSPSYTTNTESWNGTSWTELANVNTARAFVGAFGTATSAIAAGGDSGSKVGVVESWNGTSWTEVNDLNTARSELGGAGADNTYGIVYAGEIAPITGISEQWNGSTWTEVADMATARQGVNYGSGTGGSATTASGYTTAISAATEEWTIPATITNSTLTVS